MPDPPVKKPFDIQLYKDRIIARWRRMTQSITKEDVISNLKTLVWVVPLTLLIWIYAEREQVSSYPGYSIPFELRCVEPNRVISLKQPGQDFNVVVDLKGPRGRVETVLQQLRGGERPKGLVLEINRELAPEIGENRVQISRLIYNYLFSRYGIELQRCEPETVTIIADEIVTRTARVTWPESVTNLEPDTAFNPPTVELKGPSLPLNEAAEQNGGNLVIYARLAGHEALNNPGTRELKGLALQSPPELQDRRIILEPPHVDATLHVRASDEEWEYKAMPITIDAPKSVMDEFTVDYSASLPNVKLRGPKDEIADLKRPEYEPKPYAQLKVTRQDAGQRQTRRVRYLDLPEGVEADPREVTFRLIPKATATP